MAAVVYAHSTEHAETAVPYWIWDTSLELPVILLALGVLYAIGMIRHRTRGAAASRVARRRPLAFGLGVATLYLALASPIDAIGERYLFSVHMFQHVILVYPVPMLLLRGLPSAWLATWLSVLGIASLARWLTHPVGAATIFNVIFTAWHIPGLYEWALRDPFVHRLEHATILASALLMWWPILNPLTRLAPGARILYIIGLTIAQIPIVAYLTFSRDVLYPTYEIAQRLVALSPLEDQQLGGIVMKLASLGVFVSVLAMTFWRWYQEEHAPGRSHTITYAAR